MSKFTNWLFRRKPQPLPDPFDEDLEDAYLDGPSALTAEVPVTYTKERQEKQVKRYNPDFLPPPRENTLPFESDPTQAQSYEVPPPRGKPFAEWKEGEDYKQTLGYVTSGLSWRDPSPLAEHYNPAISKYRASKTPEWRGMTEDSWFNYYNWVDQPLGGHLQVIVDKSTKITFHYCQKGHVHQYINDQLAKLTRYTKKVSKHFPGGEQYFTSNVDGLYYKPLTDEIRNVPDCD